ncbi:MULTISPECIES: hypothetical protein [unclassified Crossiella]|uniref:hypothetical protein n=1 Tax=unclassified Crossiella TaxID=2620835 RepID=UPI001FFEF676|nr:MULTISPECIES: hypothetical protein [unclassified Crossiella]MCK2239365.1 hypothetical protein [Crossiella sp. S99.2]MCK2252060.1 hypothetical protein [Crossiella sp. S99.1]
MTTRTGRPLQLGECSGDWASGRLGEHSGEAGGGLSSEQGRPGPHDRPASQGPRDQPAREGERLADTAHEGRAGLAAGAAWPTSKCRPTGKCPPGPVDRATRAGPG